MVIDDRFPREILSHVPEEQPYYREYLRLAEENERLLNRIAELEAAQGHNVCYASVLESFADGFVILERDYRCVFVNKAALDILGTTRDSLIGRRLTDNLFNGFGSELREFYRDVLTGHQERQTEVYSQALERWFNVQAFTCTCGRIVVHLQDITAQKELDCQKERAQKLIEALSRSSPHIVFIVTCQGELKMVNDRFLKDVECEREEVIGRNIREFKDWLKVEDQELVSRRLKQEGRISNLEISYRARNGRLKTALISAETLVFEGEDCALVFMNDITEIKLLYEKFYQNKWQCMIADVARGIGHEIRNPMTTVRGFLQLIKEEKDWHKCQSYLDIMIDELDHANDIISEFIYLAQDRAVHKAANNLNKLLESMHVILQAAAIEKGMFVRLSLEEIPDLVFDETEIRQMILNLVSNGLDAMKPGEMLTLKTYLDEHSHVVLEVIDQGGSIDPEVLKKMGTPFFSTKDGGIGLGLAACFGIAERHNARISFENNYWGTTVRVKFNPSKS